MTDARRFLPFLVAAGLLILLQQGFDLSTLLAGSDLGTPAGRVRQVLGIGARGPALLVADLLLVWAAIGRGDGALLRGLAALHGVFGILLLAGLPFFLRDAGRVALGFGRQESIAFRVIVGRTLLLFGVTGLGALVAARTLQSLGGNPVPRPVSAA